MCNATMIYKSTDHNLRVIRGLEVSWSTKSMVIRNSTEFTSYLGCCRVVRRYFCSARDSVGKIACAASYDSMGDLSLTEEEKE